MRGINRTENDDDVHDGKERRAFTIHNIQHNLQGKEKNEQYIKKI
jgi:hypothetical protein